VRVSSTGGTAASLWATPGLSATGAGRVGVGVGVGVGVPHSGVVFAPLTLELPESPALLLARTR